MAGVETKRIGVNISGRVQGVGFRPTVYRYAKASGLSGWVSNTSQGVIIEVEGESEKITDFLKRLKSSPPPRAEITNLVASSLPLQSDRQFRILPSLSKTRPKTQISPDIAVCPECLKEILDSANRRYLYPFLNCTNCGPRFTIIKGIPYDRPQTTMKEFIMCPDCQKEYHDPLNRRFYAQPNACSKCGPKLEMLSISQTIDLLKQGKIIAIKGLGGFHLACNGLNNQVVERLRKGKYREDKPFALMAKDLDTIKKYCEVSLKEAELLNSWKRPIVLLKKKKDVAEQVAPNNKYLGWMLPYTPLHYLLFSKGCPPVLVMTSGNISDEPICFENKEALNRLKNIADYFLINNRDIYIRCDDSVARVFKDKEMLIRRARGYVPQPIKTGIDFKDEVLACGAHLKNTFCLAKSKEVFLSYHIGDLENLETLTAFEKGIEHFKKLFEIEPKIISHDLHPEYVSTKYAQDLKDLNPDLKTVAVQHHHSHIVSCLADNQKTNHQVIGIAFDGTGFGEDGNIWGGEFLLTDKSDYRRIAHFKYLPMPGGEMAIKQPWRMAASYLSQVYGKKFLDLDIDFVRKIDKNKWQVLEQMINQKVNSPLTSSAGRLFDAVASLIGLRDEINYEGQAAIELEQIIEEKIESIYNYQAKKDGKGIFIIDPKKIIQGIVADLKDRVSQRIISAKFHNTLADIIVTVCNKISNQTGLNEVALSGGVFQNMFLLEKAVDQLSKQGFKVYTHQKVPTNDGGICLGQAVIASSRIGADQCV